MLFKDRIDAGRTLAMHVKHLSDANLVVLGLPRGGVPVAYEVAKELGAPLDVIVVRKLGLPWHPELAMGAIGEGGVRVINDEVMRLAHVGEHDFGVIEARERAEVEARAIKFRAGRLAIPLAGRIALIVDDGIATGATALAACKVARAMGASRIIFAAPVGAADTVRKLASVADEVICSEIPHNLNSVGEWYEDFSATSDAEVIEILHHSSGGMKEVDLSLDGVMLKGDLTVPPSAKAIVIFAHGSGSSRKSPRNQAVAKALNEAGLATLLCDLLLEKEAQNRANVFDIEFLASRLLATTDWVHHQRELIALPIAYFGASTGGAAAVCAAAQSHVDIFAIVSRGGRVDLAGKWLSHVSAPTLLIVGDRDKDVAELNKQSQNYLTCENSLVLVKGATHLFEEEGALEQVSELAREWFLTKLPRTNKPAR
jgi:predicted phosphoribosyltransferase/alpha/beta superfamily hydrolase